MKTFVKYLTVLMFLFISVVLYAAADGSIDGDGGKKGITSTTGNDTAYTLHINKIKLPLNHKGILAEVEVDGESSGALFEEGIFLYSGGFMLSGYNGDSLWANGVAAADYIRDYTAGTYSIGGNDPRVKLYVLKKSDEPFGQAWQDWSDAVDLGAYYYDGDGNGIYNPVDLNGNGNWDKDEDRPDLLGDETVWCVYHDSVIDSLRRFDNVPPMGIEVRQTVFAYDSASTFNNVFFVRYSFLNTGRVSAKFDDVIFTIWADIDIGDGGGYLDDLAGSDTLRNSGFAYNDSTDEWWGVDPPSVFQTFLQGPDTYTGNNSDTSFNDRGYPEGLHIKLGYKNVSMGAFVHYFKVHPIQGDPFSSEIARNYMEGLDRYGNSVDPCTWQFGRVEGGVNCSEINPRYFFSGDPVTNTGWLDDFADDIRIMTSSEKFTLKAGVPVDIIVAYTVGRGDDYLSSVTEARETVDSLLANYQRAITNPGVVGVDDEQNPETMALHQNYPNPFNPATTIHFDIVKQSHVSLKVYDVLGREVAELVNEQLAAGNYESDFNAAGLNSGIYFYTLQAGDFISTKKMLLLK